MIGYLCAKLRPVTFYQLRVRDQWEQHCRFEHISGRPIRRIATCREIAAAARTRAPKEALASLGDKASLLCRLERSLMSGPVCPTRVGDKSPCGRPTKHMLHLVLACVEKQASLANFARQ